MDPTDNAGPGRDDSRRLRIGDAEREEALNALQEHLAAGRLDVDEYEQRAERVVAARFAEDLAEVLTDLPRTEAEQQRRAQRPPHWQGRLPFPVPLMVGLVLAVLVIIALPGPPFLLFPLLWVGLFLAFTRRCGSLDHGHGATAHRGQRVV